MLGFRGGAEPDIAAADAPTTGSGSSAATARSDLHRQRALPTATFWGFATALLSVIFIAIVSYFLLESRSVSQRRVRHTLDVLQHVELLGSALKDAETGQRGYLLTHDSRYLAPYESAHGRIAGELARLRPLIADNSEQEARLARLEPLIETRLAELANTIAAAKQGEAATALAIVRGGQGKRAMDALRDVIEQMKVAERDLLQRRTAEWNGSPCCRSAYCSAARRSC